MTMFAWKWNVPPDEPVIVDGLEYGGHIVLVVAENIDQAREVAIEQSKLLGADHEWIKHAPPQRIALDKPIDLLILQER